MINLRIGIQNGRKLADSIGARQRQNWRFFAQIPLKAWLAIVWRDGTFGQWGGTGVPYAKPCPAFIFGNEQFWGRAARAPRSRKRSGALVILEISSP
jgi:hypothetical protein